MAIGPDRTMQITRVAVEAACPGCKVNGKPGLVSGL
jgi:hypothetical protein